jgi:hypothetical protein
MPVAGGFLMFMRLRCAKFSFGTHTVLHDRDTTETTAMKTVAECLRMLAYLIGLATALVSIMTPITK